MTTTLPIQRENLDQLPWIDYCKPWHEFISDSLNNAGTLIQYRSPGENFIVTEMIGGMNQLGGGCGCCNCIDLDTIVLRYFVLYKD